MRQLRILRIDACHFLGMPRYFRFIVKGMFSRRSARQEKDRESLKSNKENKVKSYLSRLVSVVSVEFKGELWRANRIGFHHHLPPESLWDATLLF